MFVWATHWKIFSLAFPKGGFRGEQKDSSFYWGTVCCPKDLGSSEVRKWTILNKAVLWKWHDRGSLWKKVMGGKYGVGTGDLCTFLVRSTHRKGLWVKMTGWEYSNFILFPVGNGERVSFWHDVWCEEWSLFSTFRVLFSTTHDREASIEGIQKG